MIEHELPLGWTKRTIEDVCLINPPKSQFKHIQKDTDVSFIPMTDVEKGSYKIVLRQNKKFEEVCRGYTYFTDNDVLLAKITPCFENGKSGIVNNLTNRIGFGSTEFYVLRANDSIIFHKYLYYVIASQKFINNGINNMTGTAGQKRLKKDFLRTYSVTYPTDIIKQKQIVAKIEQLFGELNNGVNILQALKQQVKVFRQSILKAAFSGKLTGSYVSDNGLPDGWQIKKISELGKVRGGKRLPKGSEYSLSQTNFPYLRVTDFTNYGIKPNNLKYLTPEIQSKIRNYTIDKNDVYISIAGTIGLSGCIPEYLNGANLTENAAKITEINGVNNKYLAYILSSPLGQIQISEKTKATTQAKLALYAIEEIVVPISSILEQKQIVTKIEQLFDACDELDKTIDNTLSQAQLLRQSILEQAFSGKLIQDTF